MTSFFKTAARAGVVLAGVGMALPASAATFTTYTDRAAFEAALANIVIEDFNGPASNFAGNTTGGVIGTQTTVDVIGNSDSSRIGLTGDGFFAGEVDSSDKVTGDGEDLKFNTGAIFGFGLDGLQDDNGSPSFSVEEIGFEFGGESFLLSDILGLTDSSDGNFVSSVNAGPVFVGIISDTAFNSFTMVHGDFAAPGEVSGGNEQFWIDELVLGTAPSPVPLPAGLPLLLVGLGAFGMMRRRG